MSTRSIMDCRFRHHHSILYNTHDTCRSLSVYSPVKRCLFLGRKMPKKFDASFYLFGGAYLSYRFQNKLFCVADANLEKNKGRCNTGPKACTGILNILQNANKFLPHVVVGSTLLALLFPPSFTWFTPRYYTPTLGYLMFAVGINLKERDFINAWRHPSAIAVGYTCQYFIKPLLGIIFASLAVSFLHLPESIGSGLILVSCVSGAQLSNYATYLIEPSLTPLSIVLTALSTATAVFVTPILTYLLLGKQLPIDVHGMMANILQIVIVPIAMGILLNRYASSISSTMKPLLPLLSVLATALCVGAPLATNIQRIASPFGLAILIPVIGLHACGFVIGFKISEVAMVNAPNPKGLAKTISLETGMQSSLLGLALANKFFSDPLVGLPSAISVVVMTLMGFGLVELWKRDQT